MAQLMIVLASAMAGSIGAGVIALIAQRRARAKWAGRCPVCRYDRTGAEDGVCPECGVAPVTDDRAATLLDVWGVAPGLGGWRRRRSVLVALRGYIGAVFIGMWMLAGIIGTQFELATLTIGSFPALFLAESSRIYPWAVVSVTVFLSTLVSMEAGDALTAPGRTKRCALIAMLTILTQAPAFALAATWWNGLPVA